MVRICGIVALLLALGFGATAQAATLKADYRFENTLASSVSGAAALTNAPADACAHNGPNAFATAPMGARTIPVLSFQRDGGVVGPASPLVAQGSYSIAVLFKFTKTYDGLWRRIIDLSNGTSNDGLYVDPGDTLDFYNVIAGTDTFTDGAYHQVVLTRDGPTKLVSEYLDGTLEGSFLSLIHI